MAPFYQGKLHRTFIKGAGLQPYQKLWRHLQLELGLVRGRVTVGVRCFVTVGVRCFVTVGVRIRVSRVLHVFTG